MLTIPLSKGQVALIDDADLPLVSPYRWHAHRGGRGKGWYAASTVYDRVAKKNVGVLLMHRLLMPGTHGIDHWNGNSLDNRRENLRPATQTQNLANQSARGGASKFKGVFAHQLTSKWRAQIAKDKRSIHLGFFDSEVDAARAYDAAAIEIFGAYARLNLPEETTT